MNHAATACATCENTGFVRISEARNAPVTRCPSCVKGKPRYAHDVPLEFRAATLATFTVTPANRHAAKFAAAWLKQPTGDVYLFGSVGTGKTRLACAIANELHAAGTVSQFARVPMLLLKLQPSDVEHGDVFWHACQVPILVLDDLGAEREIATDFTRRTLLMLYEERGDRGLRTIWTSNHDLARLTDLMVDERLASRIRGRSDVLEMSGPDWRLATRERP